MGNGWLSTLSLGFIKDNGSLNTSWSLKDAIKVHTNLSLAGIPQGIELTKLTWTQIKHWLVPDMRRDREHTTVAPDTPRRLIYGTCRVSGQMAYMETSGDKHQYMHLIMILAGHPVLGFGDVFLDDKLIATYGADISYTLYDGTQTAACADMIAASAANATTITTAVSGNTVSGIARIGALPSVKGLFAGMTVTGSGLQAGTTISYVGDTYIDLNKTATATASTVSFSCSGSPQRWTVNHKLLGCAYVYIKLTYSETNFAAGIPKITVIVKGKSIYDPRSLTTGFSSNPALCIRDYMLMDESIGGMGCDISEIDDAAIIAAADICDQQVVRSTDGTLTEKRYHCNGTVSLGSTPKQILDGLLQSMVGEAFYNGATWRIIAGAYVAPVATIDESWLNGGISFSLGSAKNGLVNTVKGSFIDPTDSWAVKDFPVMTSSAYVAADGGEELSASVCLNYTTSPTMAQRSAKIVLEQSRIGQTVSMSCNLKAFKLSVGDAVYLNITTLGWSNRIFRVTSWDFDINGGVKLALKQDDPAIYTWTQGEIVPLLLPPPTIFPDPLKVVNNTTIADSAAELAAIADSAKLTISQKLVAMEDWDAITADYPSNITYFASQAGTAEVTAFTAAYNALHDYLATLNSPFPWNDAAAKPLGVVNYTSIVRADFNAAFANYYTARQALWNLGSNNSGIMIGGRNLFLNSYINGSSSSNGWSGRQTAVALTAGEVYILSVRGSVPSGTVLRAHGWDSVGNGVDILLTSTAERTESITFTALTSTVFYVAFYLSSGAGPYTVKWCKLETGNKATDWTPAPEDVQAGISAAATTATVNGSGQLGGTTVVVDNTKITINAATGLPQGIGSGVGTQIQTPGLAADAASISKYVETVNSTTCPNVLSTTIITTTVDPGLTNPVIQFMVTLRRTGGSSTDGKAFVTLVRSDVGGANSYNVSYYSGVDVVRVFIPVDGVVTLPWFDATIGSSVREYKIRVFSNSDSGGDIVLAGVSLMINGLKK